VADALLSIRGLSLALPDLADRAWWRRRSLRPILHDIDLTVGAGECVGCRRVRVWQDHAGAHGLAAPRAAARDIVFAGREVTHMGEVELRALRERMQMIFQTRCQRSIRGRIGEIVVQPLLAYGRLGPAPAGRL